MARKRRGRGEGSVYQRADGLWVGSTSSGYAASGRRKRVVVYGDTKRQALDKLKASDPAATASAKLTVAEFLRRWLAVYQATVQEPTYNRAKQVVEHQLCDYIGSVRLRKLTPAMIEDMYRRQAAAKMSAAMQRLSGAILGRALEYAVLHGLVSTNAARLAKRPKPTPRAMTVWTPEELSKFLNEARRHRLYAFFVLAIGSGMRLGEMLALEWSDIDFARGEVVVSKSRRGSGDKPVVPTKTAMSRRRISLPAAVVDTLNEFRRDALAAGLSDSPVFCTMKGTPLWRAYLKVNVFVPMMQRAGVPRIRLHDLRHLHASLLLQQNIHPKVVSERLGHSNVTITLNTYSHVLPGLQVEAAAKIDALFHCSQTVANGTDAGGNGGQGRGAGNQKSG